MDHGTLVGLSPTSALEKGLFNSSVGMAIADAIADYHRSVLLWPRPDNSGIMDITAKDLSIVPAQDTTAMLLEIWYHLRASGFAAEYVSPILAPNHVHIYSDPASPIYFSGPSKEAT